MRKPEDFFTEKLIRLATCLSVVLLILVVESKITCAQTTRLDPAAILQRQISPSEKHSYRLNIPLDQFFRVVVQQQPGVDLTISIYDANRLKLATVGGYRGHLSMESLFSSQAWFGYVTLSLVSGADGAFTIEVDAKDTQIRGRYEIKVEEIHPAKPIDHKRVSAERALERGEQFRFNARRASDLKLAVKPYEEALAIYREMNDPIGEANALDLLGLAYFVTEESEKAFNSCELALKICQTLGEQRMAGVILHHLASIETELDRKPESNRMEESLKIWRALGDKRSEARTLSRYAGGLGNVSREADHRLKVIDLFHQSARMFHELGSTSEEANALLQLATYYSYMSESKNSIETHYQALSLFKAIGYKRYATYVLLRLGETFYDLGDYQNAYDSYHEALEHSRNSNTAYEAYTLYNLSNSTLTLDKRKVLEYLIRALPLWEGNLNGEAYTVTSIGRYYFNENQYEEALKYYNRALSMMRGSGDEYGTGIILSHLGETYAGINDPAKAIEYYNQALQLHRAVHDRRGEGRTFLRLGDVHKATGKLELALTDYQNALNLFRTISHRNGEANALYLIATAEHERRNLSVARTTIEEALSIVELLRAGIASDELRTAYFSSAHRYYELYVDILMTLHNLNPNQGFDRLALQTVERGRARTLLELLTHSKVNLVKDIDKALIDKETELQKKLEAKSQEKVQALVEQPSSMRALAIDKEIEDLSLDLSAIKARISAASPRATDLLQSAPLDTAGIQKLLDADTMLLEYSLGDQRSFLWLVTNNEVKSFVLPKRAAIEKLSRRVYELLSQRNKKLAGETNRQAQTRFEISDKDFELAALELSRLILGPIDRQLDNKRLLIVSDGALQYVPFSALLNEDDGGGLTRSGRHNRHSFRPLILNHEIITLPSASTLAVLRRENANRSAASQTVAVLADPVFSRKDARVKAAINRGSSKNLATNSYQPPIKFSTLRALADLGVNEEIGIQRLPFSRREAETIVSMAPGKSWLKAVDFDASRSMAMSPEMSNYRVVHFATHGLVNSAHPDLSGLLFSLVDERGEPQNGFLQLHEIYNLKLNADVVVLSSCQTALGKEIKGEGLLGLTRGFMFAGAPRVVASLWKVDDAATAELMMHFYKAMLHDKQSPAAALRSAQTQMWLEGNWQQPYFWAGFTIQGEWR